MKYPIGTVARRNERERYRVQSINATFRILEDMLPSPRQFGLLKKPSKADILRHAIVYIKRLHSMLQQNELENHCLGSIEEQEISQNQPLVLSEMADLENNSYFSANHEETDKTFCDSVKILYSCKYQNSVISEQSTLTGNRHCEEKQYNCVDYNY